MQFRRWSGEPGRERVKGRRVMGREMGKEREEKVEERMQQQEQLHRLRSLHRLLTSLSHSSPREERHGHGVMASRDSKECYGEIRRDRRGGRESMHEEAGREEEDIDNQRKRPIPCSLRAWTSESLRGQR